MLQQIITHTPVYVWAILAVLVWRGLAALRERELSVRSLFIVPLVMLALSLQDLVAKFGQSALAFGAWAVAAAATALLVWRFGRSRTAPGAARGNVLFAASVCVLFGAINGAFLGRLARDVAGARRVAAGRAGAEATAG
jgi:hypothetical protein